jgi:hypothetical protein
VARNRTPTSQKAPGVEVQTIMRMQGRPVFNQWDDILWMEIKLIDEVGDGDGDAIRQLENPIG